jgi:hypothetical protein
MSVINEIKSLLGMEIKLAQMSLDNGTVIEAEVFEPQQSVFIVNGEDRIAMPIGEYKLEDGNVLEVEVEGIIASIEMPEEVVEEAPAEEEVEVEAEAAPAAPKRIVESVSKEMFFSEIEKLRNEIEELKNVKLSAEGNVGMGVLNPTEKLEVELSVEPLTHSPEVKDVKIHQFGSNRMLTTQDRVMAKLFNK